MNQTQDDFDLFDEVEDSVILSSVPGPSIENFSSQLISRLGINSHHEQRAETATLINNTSLFTIITNQHLQNLDSSQNQIASGVTPDLFPPPQRILEKGDLAM